MDRMLRWFGVDIGTATGNTLNAMYPSSGANKEKEVKSVPFGHIALRGT